MADGLTKKSMIISLAVIVILIMVGVVATRIAVKVLRDQLVKGLGPESEIKELKVGWSTVEIVGVRIKGTKGWPASETLRADSIVVKPSLLSIVSNEVQIESIEVVRPYLSMLRAGDGKLKVLPSLLDRRDQEDQDKTEPSSRKVAISSIVLKDGTMDLFDATVRKPPLKIRLEQVQASVRDIVAPTLDGKVQFRLTGQVKGIRQDGHAEVAGWAQAANRDSSVKLNLQSVDLVLLQPYLLKSGEARVTKGTLDLSIESQVKKNRLRAPGKVILSSLEFGPSHGVVDRVIGLPRAGLVSFLKDHSDRIEVDFTIEGDINSPRFSLNETFATRIAAGIGEYAGLSIRGVAEGLEGLGRTGIKGAGEAAGAVGSTLKRLFDK